MASDRKTILLIADFSHFLLDSLEASLQSSGCHVEILTLRKLGNRSRLQLLLGLLYCCIWVLFNTNENYCVSYHYLTKYSRFIDLFVSKSSRRVATIWGSDWLLNRNRSRLAAWCTTLDAVSVSNRQLLPNIRAAIPKIVAVPFGLTALPYIDRYRTHSDNTRSTIVMLGTNASPNQQHLEIIKEIHSLEERNPDANYIFVVPLHYGGSPTYREDVRQALSRLKSPIEVIDRHLDDNDHARLRCRCSILVQLQKSDQMSVAMLEAMYSGSHVITGSWLPYRSLVDLGLTFTRIDEIENLAETMQACVPLTGEQIERNRHLIYEQFGWPVTIKEWKSFIFGNVN